VIAIMTAMVISIASWPGSFNCRALFFQPGNKNRARRLQVLQGLLPLFGSVVVGVLAGIIDDPIQPAQKIACIFIRRRHGTGHIDPDGIGGAVGVQILHAGTRLRIPRPQQRKGNKPLECGFAQTIPCKPVTE